MLLLNDCCHSGVVADFFEEWSLLPERVSLIAATRKDSTTTHGIAKIVIDAWKNSKTYEPPPEPVRPIPTAPQTEKTEKAKNKDWWAQLTKTVSAIKNEPAQLFKRALRLKGLRIESSYHSGCTDIVDNWWPHQLSKVLHAISFGRYPVVWLKMRCIIGDLFPVGTVEVNIDPFPDAMRWGAVLDHLFFPPQR